MQVSAQRTFNITIDFRDGRHIGWSRAAACWWASLQGAFRQTKGEMVMIDVLALAFVAVALSLPVLIAATMLGSKLNLDW
jgi:hypothetical protein